MSTKKNAKKALLQKITAKRGIIQAFLSKENPRSKRYISITIICSAIAAALTAGPAFGGKTFTAWFTDIFGLNSPTWQLLCLGATGFSVAAVIATNLSKSHDVASKIQRAQTADAKLEGLETLIEMDHIDAEKASSLYVQYLNDIPFL